MVIGGILSSTALTLLVLYRLAYRREEEQDEAALREDAQGAALDPTPSAS